MKAIRHFQTITKHKIYVMRECFRVGLYRQGLLHDLSKYSWTEFRIGCRYYQGTRSPNNAEREDIGVSTSWLHHKGRNKHHFEHWVDYSLDKNHVIMGAQMPRKYVAEMVIDRISASKNYLKEQYNDGSALAYYLNGRHMMLIDDEADYLARYLLTMLDMRGEEYLLHYMKHTLLRHKNRDYHVRDGRLYLD